MPTPHVILAEDFVGLAIFFLVLCAVPIVGALFGLAFAGRWPKLSLTCGIFSSLLGVLILISLAHADAPLGVWVFASIPLLSGLGCLARWNSIRNRG